MSTPDQPVRESQRLESLDVLRGIAVLGILMVNVQFFAMVPTAAQYPPTMLDITGANLTTWVITHVFFELKFMLVDATHPDDDERTKRLIEAGVDCLVIDSSQGGTGHTRAHILVRRYPGALRDHGLRRGSVPSHVTG